ncbi:hypothetical protein [Paenibacillus sp. GCM10027626]
MVLYAQLTKLLVYLYRLETGPSQGLPTLRASEPSWIILTGIIISRSP